MNKIKFTIYLLLLVVCYQTTCAQAVLGVTDTKYLMVKSIFDKLTSSFANGLNEPKLVIAKKGKMKFAARFEANPTPRIIIDEELIDACGILEKDKNSALALIIGHELAHYYRKDNYYENLGFADTKTKTDILRLETMADFEACYHAQINGYNPALFGKTLDLIYQLYKLPENINGYQPKAFRKKAYDNKLKELQNKVSLYEVGTAFYFAKNYAQAADLFENLSLFFPSREVWNNLGVSYLQMGFEEMEVSSQGFILPVEFDIKTRMTSGSRGLLNDDKVEKAVDYFKRSLLMDNSYWPSRINLASAYLCLNKYHSAIHTIEEGANLPPDAYTILGIAYTHLKNLEKAKSSFEKANQMGGNGAKYNLKLFEQNQDWWLDISSFFLEMKQYVKNWFEEENSIKTSSSIKKILEHKIKYLNAPVVTEWKGKTFGIIRKFEDNHGNVKYEVSQKGQKNNFFEYRKHDYVKNIEKQKAQNIKDYCKETEQPSSAILFSNKQTVAIFNYPKTNEKLVIFENDRKQIEKWLLIK